jgi:hypothetical protein
MRFEGENWVPEGKVSTTMTQSTGISWLSCFYDLPRQCEVYLHTQLSFNSGKKHKCSIWWENFAMGVRWVDGSPCVSFTQSLLVSSCSLLLSRTSRKPKSAITNKRLNVKRKGRSEEEHMWTVSGDCDLWSLKLLFVIDVWRIFNHFCNQADGTTAKALSLRLSR